jgi:predicted nucleic acid-binding protein
VKRVLVDLNVLLDAILDRAPHAPAAVALWGAIESRRLDASIPAHGFTTLFYLIAKATDRDRARRAVGELLTLFDVAAVDEPVLRRATALDLADFEDAVTAAAAEADGCDAVVTRDPRGFTGSPVEAIDPSLALAALGDEIAEPAPSRKRPPRRRR